MVGAGLPSTGDNCRKFLMKQQNRPSREVPPCWSSGLPEAGDWPPRPLQGHGLHYPSLG